jgi:hypothetical protein
MLHELLEIIWRVLGIMLSVVVLWLVWRLWDQLLGTQSSRSQSSTSHPRTKADTCNHKKEAVNGAGFGRIIRCKKCNKIFDA